ncbi:MULTISPECIES: PLP-dependent aminotransferase family protein [Pandoraea]|uniref:aminotransferase-like domain-containing protein n=1 Tax=Pandoraea TaxID=93217 RepID=UPI001F5CA9A3|nr:MULTISPECIES: PLP-dependent aminotransferase family protein [Pandoraea]MCI3205198.1 GntR family transcriptional regulator [Pandoraea sp. LA3]MDN4583226.1 GntR family transcriptional regulator [Pandoraea capi]
MTDASSPSPVARLVERLSDDIRCGVLPPGMALPTHRKLALQYGIAIASATKVYAKLRELGLVVGEVGRGTFVRDRPMQREWDVDDEARLSSSAVDLSFNHPSWPEQSELLRATLRELATAGDLSALMRQQPPGGRQHEREIVAAYLRDVRGIKAESERVFLVGGAQQGLDVVVRAALRPGDAVAVDALTYPGFRMTASLGGLAMKPVPYLSGTNGSHGGNGGLGGPDLAALDALCRRHAIRAIYTMPTLHNPLGWVLSEAQRRALVEIARRHDCLIVEDATYAYLVDDAPPPIVTLAPERTFHVSSVSKSVATGMRFGYVVAPKAHAADVKRVIRATYWSLPSIVTAIATRWLASGDVERQEQRQRERARQRQAIAREVLRGMTVVAHPSSLFLWLPLPEGLRMDQVASALAASGIAVSKAQAYATTRHAPHALRLGLSSMSDAQVGPVLAEVRAVIDRLPL